MTHAEQLVLDERALADAALAFLGADCSHGPERKALEVAGARVREGRARRCVKCGGSAWVVGPHPGMRGELVDQCDCDNGRTR
jgi:hypothetical protein